MATTVAWNILGAQADGSGGVNVDLQVSGEGMDPAVVKVPVPAGSTIDDVRMHFRSACRAYLGDVASASRSQFLINQLNGLSGAEDF